MTRLLIALAGVLLSVGACTSTSPSQPTQSGGTTRTVTHTRSTTGTAYQPPAPATVKPLPPGVKPAKGEKDRACPYIKSGLNETSDGGVNLADIEGDRVYRTTVLKRYHPVGCRFYFFAPPYEAVAEIRPVTFPSKLDAFNAMIRTARTGHELITERDFVKGVTGICFRTKFFGPDGKKDWAFVFAKGRVMVVVYTQRTDTSRNALYLARAIAAKF